MEKEKLLISACFLKTGYKYDGKANILDSEIIDKLKEKYELVIVCPEVEGGLPTPRIPSEQLGDKVYSKLGKDVTYEFVKGAKLAYDKVINLKIKKALLKAKSPSCGRDIIYDGTFTHHKIPGDGVLVKMLRSLDIKIYTEEEVNDLI